MYEQHGNDIQGLATIHGLMKPPGKVQPRASPPPPPNTSHRDQPFPGYELGQWMLTNLLVDQYMYSRVFEVGIKRGTHVALVAGLFVPSNGNQRLR